MIAVELMGVHMMGCAYLYVVHVVLYTGFARSFTTCRNYVVHVLLGNTITHAEQ